ncbi:MAG TPA: PPOX class F420-dependent oxidoreductase [Acidimicrobiia bacterium]|jgi:PPOX class probable F420-dependent enzyme|nr:PPOX class F420-dependent oxidoreductase [Acidimicrobiia bacterium]
MLSEESRQLAEGANHAVLTTLFPSGRPQTNVVWIDHDDEHLLVNSETERQKVRNVRRDPRVSVLVFDASDMDNWVEVRGRVVEIVEGEEARRHIDTLAQKYLGVPDYPNPIRSPRVILRIRPDRENVY